MGLLLYLIFKVNHPGTNHMQEFSGNSQDGINDRSGRWNDLATPSLPSPRLSLHEFSQIEQSTPHPSKMEDRGHALDTPATVYIEGESPGGAVQNRASPSNSPLILSAIDSFLGNPKKTMHDLANKAEEIRNNSGAEAKIPAGSELHVEVLRTVDGPGNRLPVIARLRSDSLSTFHLPAGTKILGLPESVSSDNRLRIRFVKVLYPGGFEAHTTGFALSGGREGVPVDVTRNTGGSMARSMAQNGLMMGGEAMDTIGWSGTNMGDLLAMQAGGNALAVAGSQLPAQNNRARFRLSEGTQCSVMILESFPVPEEGGR